MGFTWGISIENKRQAKASNMSNITDVYLDINLPFFT